MDNESLTLAEGQKHGQAAEQKPVPDQARPSDTPPACLSLAVLSGVPEPPEDPQRLADEDDILLLMPGLAFDRAHNRVGYGGGFYDRYLERLHGSGARVFKPALAYEFQIVDSIPANAHDVRVDAILTAEEIL